MPIRRRSAVPTKTDPPPSNAPEEGGMYYCPMPGTLAQYNDNLSTTTKLDMAATCIIEQKVNPEMYIIHIFLFTHTCVFHRKYLRMRVKFRSCNYCMFLEVHIVWATVLFVLYSFYCVLLKHSICTSLMLSVP